MNRKLMDYIRAEGSCNYYDIIDYFTEINNLGCDKLKANALGDIVWFIANTENMSDEEFKRHFNTELESELNNESIPPSPPKSTLKPTKITEGFKGGF